LLLFTQDGTVAKQVIGQDSLLEKEYVVGIREPLDGLESIEPKLEKLRSGMIVDGRTLKDAKVNCRRST
jgi:23S rRNA pseudouridine2604 synthase